MLGSLLSNFHLPVSSLHEAPAKKQSKGRDAVSHTRCLDLGDGRLAGRYGETFPFNACIPLLTSLFASRP
jgi:hypothetical protein